MNIKYTESLTTLCVLFTFSTILSLLLHHRKASRTSLLASLAHVCMLLGGAVLLVRDQLPAQTVFILSNLCFEASLFSSWLGMLHFHHLQRRHRHWKGLIGIIWLGSTLLLALHPALTAQYRWRMLTILPFYLVLFGMMSWLAARLRSDQRPLSQSICIYLGLTGAVVAAARLLLALHIQTTFPDEADLPLQSIMMTLTAICMFGLALALVFWQFENGTSHLKKLANLDGLTGLPNRRSFIELGKQLLSRHPASSLLVIDIDHFKQVNDNHGHQAGDQVLRQLGGQLRQLARQHDLLCRYGGEEFCILLPQTTAQQAAKLAERLRLQISQEIFVIEDGTTLPVTLSIGGASTEGSKDRPRLGGLFTRADKALYQAKKQGRNQVVMVTEMADEPGEAVQNPAA